MIQKIVEQDGYMFLHFGDLPGNVGKIEFVNCVAHQQNQILFCKWRDNDIWVLPGGRVDPGETVEETAHRELLEETGATLKSLEVLCYIHCFMYNLEYWGIAYCEGHGFNVSSLVFSTDGTILASGSEDGTALIEIRF